MADIIQVRKGLAALATSVNPKLAEGEIGYETDTRKFKFGDGINFWNDLPYSALTQEQADFAETNNTLVTFIKNKPDLSTFHTQGTDTTLGVMTADINMNTHKVKNLSVPTSNGDSIRATTKITEVHLETVYDNTHTHSNKSTLDNIQEALTTALKSGYDGAVSWITTNGSTLLGLVGFPGFGTSHTTAAYGDHTHSIPTALSDLSDDTTHRTVTDTEKSTWNSKANALGTDDNYVTDTEKANLHAPNSDNQIISDATITTTDITDNNVSTSKHGFFPKLPTSTGKYLKDDMTWGTPTGGGGSSLWTLMPGTPTRSDNTTFTVTDTSNTLKLDLLLSRLTCIKWTESATLRQAMITGAVYGTNTVTITIMGDTLTSIDASSMKYFAQKANFYKFATAGNVGSTGTNIMNTVMCEVAGKIYGCDAYAGTAGSGTTTFDINKNGTTMYTSKPSITTTTRSVLGKTADTGTVTAVGDFLTVDIDAVAATNIIDAYIYQYYLPLYNTYLS